MMKGCEMQKQYYSDFNSDFNQNEYGYFNEEYPSQNLYSNSFEHEKECPFSKIIPESLLQSKDYVNWLQSESRKNRTIDRFLTIMIILLTITDLVALAACIKIFIL